MKLITLCLLIIALGITCFPAGCADGGASDSPDGVIKTENLIMPATFQEMLGLFQEAHQITLDAGEEVSYSSYTYEGTEEVNGIETDLVELYTKHADEGETTAKAWFDAEGNIVQYELDAEEFPEEHGEELIEGIAGSFTFFHGFLPDIDDQAVFVVITGEEEDSRYSLLGSRYKRFGDMEVAVYSIGEWHGFVGEETPTTKFDLADFGDFQTIVSLELSEAIVSNGGSFKVIIDDAVLR